MNPLKVGDRVVDNYPHNAALRTATVTAMDETHATLAQSPSLALTRVKLRSIHTDGKPRRSGWSIAV